MTRLDDDEIARHAATWRSEGWVLVDGLVPTDEIDAAADELWQIYPPAEVFHHDPDDARTAAFWSTRRTRERRHGDPGDGPAFRDDQFLGLREFPLPAPAVNALVVHPEILRFAKSAMEADVVRLYQAQTWAKYTGVTDYAQPLHRDLNHSVVPPSAAPGFRNLEGFLYLTDVDHEHAPPRLVPLRHTAGLVERAPLAPGSHPDLDAVAVPAVGRRGSFLAYRSDVWHQGTALTAPEGVRVLLSASFRPAGADWIGYTPLQKHGTGHWFRELVRRSTVDQLVALGFPEPGHPYWTPELAAETAAMYPGLDTGPFLVDPADGSG